MAAPRRNSSQDEYMDIATLNAAANQRGNAAVRSDQYMTVSSPTGVGVSRSNSEPVPATYSAIDPNVGVPVSRMSNGRGPIAAPGFPAEAPICDVTGLRIAPRLSAIESHSPSIQPIEMIFEKAFQRKSKKIALGLVLESRDGKVYVKECKPKSLSRSSVMPGWVLLKVNGQDVTPANKKKIEAVLKKELELHLTFDSEEYHVEQERLEGIRRRSTPFFDPGLGVNVADRVQDRGRRSTTLHGLGGRLASATAGGRGVNDAGYVFCDDDLDPDSDGAF